MPSAKCTGTEGVVGVYRVAQRWFAVVGGIVSLSPEQPRVDRVDGRAIREVGRAERFFWVAAEPAASWVVAPKTPAVISPACVGGRFFVSRGAFCGVSRENKWILSAHTPCEKRGCASTEKLSTLGGCVGGLRVVFGCVWGCECWMRCCGVI